MKGTFNFSVNVETEQRRDYSVLDCPSLRVMYFKGMSESRAVALTEDVYERQFDQPLFNDFWQNQLRTTLARAFHRALCDVFQQLEDEDYLDKDGKA